MATRRPKSINAVARKAFKIEGIQELQDELAKLVRDVGGQSAGQDIKETYLKAAMVVRNEARRMAGKKTGALRQAIFASRGDVRKPSALVGVNYKMKGPDGSKTATHAHLVEFGHGGPHPAPPHPFMRPAVEGKRTEVTEIIKSGLADIIKKYS